MSRRLFAPALALVLLAAGVHADEPSLTPPPAPDPAALATLPAYELARGYLAAIAALPLADSARQALGILNLGIDGKAYIVNSANAVAFIPLLKARADAFGKVITMRGSSVTEGQYALATGAGCKGERFDPRFIFSAGKAANGEPVMATSARIIQNGLETDVLVTLSQNRQTIGEVLTGVAVENTLVLADVMSAGFSLYGSVVGNTIELRLDPLEVKDAIGAAAGTEADWKLVDACVFTLSKK
jgi:hypothetical protein